MPATLDRPAEKSAGAGPFASGDFKTFPALAIFAEHSTKSREGKILRFGQTELQAIVDRCNERIRDTGDYAAVVLGHTPDKEALAAGAEMPELVGFAGPFRLGTLGQQRPRWAIVADFHIFKDCVEKAKRFPRRSAEVWLEEAYEDMIIDPISLLGAEAPRLDLGLALFYSRRHAGRVIERYSALLPAQPAQPKEQTKMNLTPDDVQAIVGAFDGLDWVQWAKDKMKAEKSDNSSVRSRGPLDEGPTRGAVPFPVDDTDDDFDDSEQVERTWQLRNQTAAHQRYEASQGSNDPTAGLDAPPAPGDVEGDQLKKKRPLGSIEDAAAEAAGSADATAGDGASIPGGKVEGAQWTKKRPLGSAEPYARHGEMLTRGRAEVKRFMAAGNRAAAGLAHQLAVNADVEYRAGRAGVAARALEYGLRNQCDYETALYRIGADQPLPLVPSTAA